MSNLPFIHQRCVVASKEKSEPCNLSVLADKATFHCLLSAYGEVVCGVTHTHLSTPPKVAKVHSIEPCTV